MMTAIYACTYPCSLSVLEWITVVAAAAIAIGVGVGVGGGGGGGGGGSAARSGGEMRIVAKWREEK